MSKCVQIGFHSSLVCLKHVLFIFGCDDI